MTAENSTGPSGVGPGFFRQLCDTAAVAMVATDKHLRVVCWNTAAAALLGRSEEEMLGRCLDEAVPPSRRRLLRKVATRTMRRGVTTNFELHIEAGQGRDKDVTAIISPIPDRSGRVQGVAAWLVDQTNRKRLAERLARAEKMASLGTLARGVAHHFNNILGGVVTYVDFAAAGNDVATMQRALRMSAEAAARVSRITQSLLSFAEGDTRQTDLADLTEVVLTFVQMAERPLGERNIALKLDLQPVPVVPVETNRMHQVLGNLMTNSEESMPDGGRVDIGIHSRGDEVVLTFADTGCGIRGEDLSLVFEPFFTTKGLLAGGDKGNPGLGLSVVHGIVQEMGGRIEAISEPGRGTTLVLTFPVSREQDA